MRLLLLTSFFFMQVVCSLSQTAPNKYWVRFSDKDNSSFSTSNPSEFLSERALARRAKSAQPITTEDLPVNSNYIQDVLSIGNIEHLHSSKWFNAITIKTTDSTLIAAIEALPFVSQVRQVRTFHSPIAPEEMLRSTAAEYESSLYGEGLDQLKQINGDYLHALGFSGEGMWIGVLDAGFKRTPVLPIFDRLYERETITEVHDYVDWDNIVTDHHYHGTYVLSTMGGYLQDSLVGTAPDAHYFLFRTEDGSTEYLIEEDNWVAAIEEADSMGIDIVNSSLGYSTFDDPEQDHSYLDMDGRTTHIAIAATMAARRGMLVVTSAGNLGSSDWHYISTPGDADSILTVGAVNNLGEHAPFSSFGPTADGRVKPNVVAMGQAASFAANDSTIRQGNGTSFSSPILCGMAACLWQAHPQATNMEIIDAIERSAHLYTNPNDSLGYGIPDFGKAHLFLLNKFAAQSNGILIYPNPSAGLIRFEVEGITSEIVRIYDTQGRILADLPCVYIDSSRGIGTLDLRTLGLTAGIYYLQFEQDHRIRTVRAILE